MSASIPNQISFQCPFCDKKLRAPQKLAGKQLNCPKCSQLLEVPKFDEANPELGQNKHDEPNSLEPDSNGSKPPAGTSFMAGSLFDDDLPELAPLVQSALQQQSMGRDENGNSTSGRPPEAGHPNNAKSKGVHKTPASRSEIAQNPPLSTPHEETEKDEFKLAPVEATAPKSHGLPFDLDTLTKDDHAPKSLDVDLDKLHLPGNALEVGGGKSREQEFGFSCKICGTRMVAVPSKIGTIIQCTDCHSKIKIPPPAVTKAKPATISREELAEVSFEPITAQSSKQPVTTKSQTEELLRKAKDESDAEQDELDALMVDFDTQKWIARSFWFLKDPQLIFIIVLMGAFASIWLAFVSALPEILQIQNPRVSGIVQMILFVGPGVAFASVLMALGVCVVNMVANQYRRIEDWPFGRPGEVFGEVIAVASAAAIAAAPGGMLGMAISTATGLTIAMPCLAIASFWFLFPFVFLSISENGAVTEPFSQNIYDSIRSKWDHWGAMYLQTMLAALVLFTLVSWSIGHGQLGEVALGLFLPFLVLFLFNQYGLLAGRISEVTGLNFTGDFSEDEAEDENK